MDEVELLHGYQPHTRPFAHQAKAFNASAKKVFYALMMDPGTGKSKVVIDTTAFLYQRNKITGLLIVAPNDVDEQWIDQEIPRHLPPHIHVRAQCWNAHSQRARRLCTELATRPLPNRLHVLAMNHEAFATHAGREVAIRFLRTYRSLFCLDEAHAIKSHKAVRTRWMTKIGKGAVARRALSGTPITKVPFDLFSIFGFLHEEIIGFDSFIAFKHEYADWVKEWTHRFNPRTKQKELASYESIVGYKNLDKLYARLDPYIFRQLKEDCTDLPPKMYSILPVHLSEAQLQLYQKVQTEGILLLEKVKAGQPVTPLDLQSFYAQDDGLERDLLDRLMGDEGRITSLIKLVTMLRCRQIVGGYITTDAGEVLCIDGEPSKCTRMQAMRTWVSNTLESAPGKIIIWARFRAELKGIAQLIREELKEDCALIYGESKPAQKRADIQRFKDRSNPLRILVTHEQSMGVGMDFNMASDMLFYSSSHSYYQRAQAEDRAHRIGQKGTVTITDLHAKEVEIDREMAEARATAESFKTQFMTWKPKEDKQ